MKHEDAAINEMTAKSMPLLNCAVL